jgi:hypothetical protein
MLYKKITMKWFYIFVISTLSACSSDNQKLYEEKIDKLQLKITGLESYDILIDTFKEVEGRFPDSLEEVYLAYKHDYPEDIGIIERHHFMDIFNKKEKWIGYFPIYNSDNSQIISYLILSAGIDGKLDNIYDPCSKLHLDDWKQKLDLYNPEEFDEGIKGYLEKSTYNAREEESGNKDLLIFVYHLWCALPYNERERTF